MKKGLTLFLIVPFLCSCSAKEISNEEAYRRLIGFEVKIEQETTFSFYERKAVSVSENKKTTSLTQVFFEDNYMHSYAVTTDYENPKNSTATENWVYVKDNLIYQVQTDQSEKSSNGKIHQEMEFDKDIWDQFIKDSFNEVKETNKLYFTRLKNEYLNQTSSTKIISRSNNETSLHQTIERSNSSGVVIRTKIYEFKDSRISSIIEKDDYSTSTFTFQYKISNQEVRYPDL